MKKQSSTTILFLLMVLAVMLFSTACSSTPETGVYVGGIDVSGGGYFRSDGEGGIIAKGANEDNYVVHYDSSKEPAVLTLNNATITKCTEMEYNDLSIYKGFAAIYSVNPLIINLIGNNTINSVNNERIEESEAMIQVSHGIYMYKCGLTIQGNGSMEVTAGTAVGISNAVLVIDGDMEIKDNATLIATSNSARQSYGVAMYQYGDENHSIIIHDGRLVAAVSAEAEANVKIAFYSEPSSLPSEYYWRTTRDGAYTHTTSEDTAYAYSAEHTYVDIRTSLRSIAFTAQPTASTTVTEGSISGSLTAAASATPAYNVTLNWYACSEDGTKTGASLGTGSTFNIPTSLASGDYYYLCEATCPDAKAVASSVAFVMVKNSADFSGLAAKDGSDTASTTALTLTFDKDIMNLTADDITLTGATKGTLTKESGTGKYTLGISNITVPDGGTVNVAVSKNSVTFTPTNRSATVRRQTYGITLTPAALSFGALPVGYAQPAAQTVTMTYAGNSDQITLSQPSSTQYDIGTLSNTTLSKTNNTATFTVRPKPGLGVGTYSTPIIIHTSHSEASSFSIMPSFTVNGIPSLQIHPNATFMQGNAPDTTVTIGSGIAGFDLDNFVSAQMGPQGGTLAALHDGTDYFKANGSIVITLRSSYLNTLAPGTYTLQVNLTGAGYPSHLQSTIHISARGTDIPDTGDTSTPILWLELMLLAGTALTVGLVFNRKRQSK